VKQQVAALPGAPEALLAGLRSVIAPCTIPLVPAWIALSVATSDRLVTAVGGYCAAVTAHLVVIGIGSNPLYETLRSSRGLPGPIGAVLVAAVAAVLLVGHRARTFSLFAGLAVGAAFGAAWTPCVGRVLGSLLTPGGSTAGRGALLVVYGFGLTLPMLLMSLAVPALPRLSLWVGAHRAGLTRVGAAALLILGVALAGGWYRSIASSLARVVVPGT
jgi:cytochrome c-type biogenesis protein